MSERLQQVLHAWASRHGVSFEWRPDFTISYTGSRGAWFVSTLPINASDDWIAVHPTGDGDHLELEKVADAGHVEVLRLGVDELANELDGVLDWFGGWTDFFAEGPGKGH